MTFEAFITILGMAVVTYGTRAGGMWLMGRVALSRPVEKWLGQLPGAVLVALAAPAVINSGLAGLVAGLATLLVARKTGNLLFAMLTGVIVIWGLRQLLSLA